MKLVSNNRKTQYDGRRIGHRLDARGRVLCNFGPLERTLVDVTEVWRGVVFRDIDGNEYRLCDNCLRP